MSASLGASTDGDVTRFAVRAPKAQAVFLCLFDKGVERQIQMNKVGDDWLAELPGDLSGTCYGYRAQGEWSPENGMWFDPAKLLVDPYAVELDRRFVQIGTAYVLIDVSPAIIFVQAIEFRNDRTMNPRLEPLREKRLVVDREVPRLSVI